MKSRRFPGLYTLLLYVCLSSGCSSDDNNEPQIPLSAECRITSFRFTSAQNGSLQGDVAFKIDQNAGTITAVYTRWIDKNDPDRLIATFQTTGTQVTVDGAGQQSGLTSNSFRDELTYTVKAENGETRQYKVSFICPQINGELPVLRIRPEKAIVDKVNYVSAKLDMLPGTYSAPGLWSESDGNIEIRLRGNSTMSLPKKPYRIKFPAKFSPLDLKHTSAKSWTLLANDCDKTLLRNSVAFAMSSMLFNSDAWALRDSRAILFTAADRPVNVYMNSEYIGLYTMSDQIEQDGGRIAIESLKESDGSNPDRITGGYLLEVDIHASRSSEPFYFASWKGIKITPQYPKDDDHDQSQYTYIRNHLTIAEKALFNASSLPTAQWQAEWRKYWDEATAIDFFLVNEMTGNPDGFTSINIYKRRGCDKFFFGPVWDFDKAYNNDRRTQNPLTNLMVDVGFFTMESGYPPVNWHGQMLKDPSFKTAVKNRWNSKKAQLLAKAQEVLGTQTGMMPRSIIANFTVWKITEQALGDAMPPPSNYQNGITSLDNYVKTRYTFLDNLFNQYP